MKFQNQFHPVLFVHIEKKNIKIQKKIFEIDFYLIVDIR